MVTSEMHVELLFEAVSPTKEKLLTTTDLVNCTIMFGRVEKVFRCSTGYVDAAMTSVFGIAAVLVTS